MEKALVTGGAGFIGSWIVDELIDKGLEVIVLDNLSSGNKKIIHKNAKFYQVDIRDKKRIFKIFSDEKPNYVFHLAAQISVRDSMKYPGKNKEINIAGSKNIINACPKTSVKKFIFSSTGGAIYDEKSRIPTSEKAYPNPKSNYGKSKLIIENYLNKLQKYKVLDSVILRYSNVYGPRQNSKGEAGVIAIFAEKLLSKKIPLINGTGKQTRDYVYVRDVVNANILAMKLSGIYNVGTGTETNVNELFKNMAKITGKKIREVHGRGIKGEQLRSCLNAEKLIEKGWESKYSLEEGLKETIDWFKKHK